MKIFKKSSVAVLVTAFTLVLMGSSIAQAAVTTPSLGTAGIFGVLSSTFTRNIGETVITGSAGYTTLSGGGSDTVSGTTYQPAPPQSGIDQAAALADLNAQVLDGCTSLGAAVNLDNVTGHETGVYTPGCYSSSGAMNITTNTTVTLDGSGTYIFKSGGALDAAASSTIVLINGASACDVFWIPVGATTIGATAEATTTPTFVGNIFRGVADGLSITLGHFANISGRLLAFGSTVTADTNTITAPSCGGTAPATLHVIKFVDNSDGGTATPSDFNLSVKLSGTNVAGSPALGTSTPGTLYLLSPDTYAISEGSMTNYTQSFSSACPSGNITLSASDDETCTVTNTYVVPVVPTSRRSGGGGTHYGCKDPSALNYENFVASKPSLCLYAVAVATTSTTTVSTYKFPDTGISDGVDLTQEGAAATFYRPLSIGSKGGDVSALQTALVQKGFLVIPFGIAKGYFGLLTQAAISKYQTRSSLPSIGVFGPLTRAKLISELSD